MTHRVVEIGWLPKLIAEWGSFSAARLEAANLWNRLVAYHAEIRRLKLKWPNHIAMAKLAHGKFPNLGSHSVQAICKDFYDAIVAATEARKVQAAAGLEVTARHPWKTKKYRDVPYSNQMATVKDGILRLSHGRGGNIGLRITLPKNRPLPGRIMEVQLSYGVIRLVCEVPEGTPKEIGSPVGVDLGVNTIIAATDGKKAILISGRELKSIVRYRNKALGELVSRIDLCKQGSKRQKHLARAKHKMLAKSKRKVKDILHKATRIVADAFPNSPVIVGKPFNQAAQKIGRVWAQQVSSASNAKVISMLDYKMSGSTEKNEAYTSQTCPVCGCRQKCRRVYKCKGCGFTTARDVVGATNILRKMVPDASVPSIIVYRQPLRKYSGVNPDRSAGIAACS